MSNVIPPKTADRQMVPKFLRVYLYTLFIVAGATSIPFLGKWGPLPTTELLDAWVILFILACFLRGRIETTLTIGLLGAYLLTRIIPALYIDAPLQDFAQAYRWVLYLIAFAFAVGRKWGPVGPLVRVMWILLSLALTKTVLTFAILGPGERPGLLLENNFEIALFAGLVIVLYKHLGRGRPWAVLLMGTMTLLSGSRSGAVAFLILALFAVTQAKGANLFVKYVLGLLVPALIFVPAWIFQQRAIGATQVDRLNFLDVFWAETANWDALQWIFGSTPITALSDGACFRLSYYQMLFSSEGDGSCYSVILHAFILRVVFDAGVLGLVIAFGVAWCMMRRGRVQFGVAFALILVAFTNSLSVSGPNNPYVALPILLSIVTASSVVAHQVDPKPRSVRKARARVGIH